MDSCSIQTAQHQPYLLSPSSMLHGDQTSPATIREEAPMRFSLNRYDPYGPALSDSAASAATESFFGFVKEKSDAELLVEASIRKVVRCITELPIGGIPRSLIRSGSVIVFRENSNTVAKMRWRDGISWTTSRISGPFLLYREVEASSNPIPIPEVRAIERNDLFSTTNVKAGTSLIPNGLAKRTITLVGSDQRRYRVVSYFYPQDVEHLYSESESRRNSGMLVTPSMVPELTSAFSNPSTQPVTPRTAVVDPPAPYRVIVATPDTQPRHFLLDRFEREALPWGGSGLRDMFTFFQRHPEWYLAQATLPVLHSPYLTDSKRSPNT